MSAITVTQVATVIANTIGGNDLFGQNSGANTVYLSGAADITSGNRSLAVVPGGAFTWPGGKALYACTDSGLVSQITTANNGAAITQGQVNVGQVNTNTVVLAVWNKQVANGTEVMIYDSGNVNTLLPFQSLLISAQAAAVASSINISNIRISHMTLDGTIIGVDRPAAFSGGTLYYTIPVKGSRVQIFINPTGTEYFTALPVTISASPAKLPRSYYSSPALLGNFTNGNLTASSFQDATSSGSLSMLLGPSGTAYGTAQLPSISGSASVFIMASNANQTNVYLNTIGRDSSSQAETRLFQYVTNSAVASNSIYPLQMTFPEAPITISVGPNSTANVFINITWLKL